MTHARHKAPARMARLDPRRADKVVVLTGVVMLSVAVLGASFGPPPVAAPRALALAEARATSIVAPTADESADLRELRQHAILQASRGADRTTAVPAPVPAPIAPPPVAPLPVTTTAYTTVAVNLRAAASSDSDVLAVLDPGAEIAVTGKAAADYVEIVHDARLAWVYAAYVTDTPLTADADEDVAEDVGAVSGAPCASGSGVESGLTTNAVAVHRAVCALFPGVTAYGGLRPGDGGEHGSGHALDIMVPTDLGNQIVEYLQPRAGELGILELIWQQRIWSSERASDGWRWMEDRGSATANHYDHVHVTVG